MEVGSLSHHLICGILVFVCTINLNCTLLLQCFLLKNLDWQKVRLHSGASSSHYYDRQSS